MNAPSTVQIAAFLKRHAASLRTTPRAQLLRFVDWYVQVAGCAVLREGGRIKAVALGRCVNSIEQAERDDWAHDEAQGRIIWIQQIVSLHRAGIGALLLQAARRFGRREAFAGHVFLRDGELRMLPWNVVERFNTVTF